MLGVEELTQVSVMIDIQLEVWTIWSFHEGLAKKQRRQFKLAEQSRSSTVGPYDKATLGGVTSSIGGGEKHLYVITSNHEQKNSPNVVTGMIKVLTFYVYTLLEPEQVYLF